MAPLFFFAFAKPPKSAMIYAMSNGVAEKTNSRIWEILEEIFFALFLFSIPLQTRLTFVTHETYQRIFFNEYATFFLYLSDILFIITLFLFFVNPVRSLKLFSLLNNAIRRKPLSLENLIKGKEQFRTSNGVNTLTKIVNFSKILNKLSTYPLLIPLLALFPLIAWGFLSIYWSNYKEISFYKSLKFAEFGLLFFYTAQSMRWFGLTKLLSIIFVAGFFQSIIGILQYLYQHSLGLKILGESILAPNIDNVAKIVVDGEKIIRAYGTFPHPNIFAGFLVLSIFSGFWLLFSFKPSNWNMRGKLWITLLTLGGIFQLFAFALTFSRVAWLGAIFVAVILLSYGLKMAYLSGNVNYGFHPPTFMLKLFHACPPKLRHFLEKLFNLKQNSVNVSRETFYTAAKESETTLAFFHLNKPKISALVIIFIAFTAFLALNRGAITSRTIDSGQNYQQAISYRLLYNDIAIKMIKDQPLTGFGNGTFTVNMKNYSPAPHEWWQYQPVHNIYLLINSELGIIGLILFLIFVFSVLKMAYLKHNKNYDFHPPTFLLKLFHVKQLPNYALNKPNKSMGEEISAGKRETILFTRLMLAVFVGFLFIGLFDHYFWTLQQGQLTFWLVLGVLMASMEKGLLE